MGQVGSFPNLSDFRHRTIRAPSNPLDKCTLVSIYPNEVYEVNHTIQPGKFLVPGGSFKKPGVLVVGTSSWWKELDEESPLLEIPVSSIQVADSVVRDYCVGLLACNMSTQMPGLFYIPGEISLVDLLSKYQHLLLKAKTTQDNWYKELIKLADGLWTRSGGNPLAISDDMRLAAREMGIDNKEWLQDFQIMESVRCVACGNMRNPAFPMCPNCKTIIDTKKYEEMGLKQS